MPPWTQNMFHAREPIMFLTYCSSPCQHNIIDARSGLVVILTSTITVRLPQGDERWLACNQLSCFMHSNLNLAFRRTDEKAHFLWSEAFKVSFGFSLLTFLWRRWRFQFSSDDVHCWREKTLRKRWELQFKICVQHFCCQIDSTWSDWSKLFFLTWLEPIF